MSRPFPRALLFGLGMVLSCDGLGRPVVDDWKGQPGAEVLCTRMHPRCTDAEPAPTEVQAGARSSELPACAPEGAGSPQRIVAVLRDCSLSLRATSQESWLIADSSLDNVTIELEGPIDLRIRDSDLFRVTLTHSSDAADVEHSVQVSHSDLRLLDLRVPYLELISTFVSHSMLHAGELSFVDVQAQESVVSVSAATISASRLNAFRLAECEALLIAESRLTNSRFEACEGATRLYDVEANACSFDGQLESDLSSFADSRFGVRALTQLQSWQTVVDNSVLCNEVDNLRLSAGSFRCISCKGPLEQPSADACSDPVLPASTEANFCAALVAPPICQSFPPRSRPFI